MDGSRIFLVGYESEVMYRVQMRMGEQTDLPPRLISRAMLTLCKIVYSLERGAISNVFMFVTGLVLLPLQIRIFKKLLDDRRQMYQYLQKLADVTFGAEGGHTSV